MVHSFCKQSTEDLSRLEAEAQAAGKKLAVEVIADSSGTFAGNMKRFDTAADAVDYGDDLSSRWTLVREFRVVIADPVNWPGL